MSKHTSHGMFRINIKVCFLITYSIEIFYFHTYEDFYGLSNNVLHVLGTQFSMCFGNLKIRQCNVIYPKRVSDAMFLINHKCVF